MVFRDLTLESLTPGVNAALDVNNHKCCHQIHTTFSQRCYISGNAGKHTICEWA
jgi:hypothetical protein